MQETDIIEKIILKVAKVNSFQDGVRIGIGDDAALLDISNINALAISNDSMIENVHFPIWASAYSVGTKLATVNLSDLAACGAMPLWASLALSIPKSLSIHWVEEFIAGLYDQLSLYRVRLIGGDTCQSEEINVGLTVFGSSSKFVSRDGAKTGDNIYVSGTLGNAALALNLANKKIPPKISKTDRNREKYRFKALKELDFNLLLSLEKPQPRVNYALKMLNFASSMIDISDGLISDLCHLLKQSNLHQNTQNQGKKIGAQLFLNDKLISNSFKNNIHLLQASHLEQTNPIKKIPNYWALILGGGDDYQLCYTIAAERQEEWLAFTQKHNLLTIHIGKITGSGNLVIENTEILNPEQLYAHRNVDFSLKGFEHSFG